jgi:hypothetical protein
VIGSSQTPRHVVRRSRHIKLRYDALASKSVLAVHPNTEIATTCIDNVLRIVSEVGHSQYTIYEWQYSAILCKATTASIYTDLQKWAVLSIIRLKYSLLTRQLDVDMFTRIKNSAVRTFRRVFFRSLKGKYKTCKGASKKNRSCFAIFAKRPKQAEIAKPGRAIVPGRLALSLVVETDFAPVVPKTFSPTSSETSTMSSNRSQHSPTGGLVRSSTVVSFRSTSSRTSLTGPERHSAFRRLRQIQTNFTVGRARISNPEEDWKMALAKRNRELTTLRERVRSDVPADSTQRPSPLQIIIPAALQRKFGAATTYIGNHFPWERGILAVQEIIGRNDETPSSRWGPSPPGTQPEDSESDEEGFLDANCEPFVF